MAVPASSKVPTTAKPPEEDLAAVRYGELSIVMFDDGDFHEYTIVGNDDWGWAGVEEG